MIRLNKKLKISTENKNLSIFPNYLFGIVLTSKLKEHLGISYPPMFCEYRNDSNRWANDIISANENAEKVLNRIIKDKKFIKRIIRLYDNSEEKITNICKSIEKTDLTKLSKNNIIGKFNLFIESYCEILVYGWLPIASEGFDSSFTNLLKKFIQKRIGNRPEKINDYFVVLSTCMKETRRQKAEQEIRRFVITNKNKKWFGEIGKLKYDENPVRFNEKIRLFVKDYLEKYSWLTFDYEGPLIRWKDVMSRLDEVFQETGKGNREMVQARQKLYGDGLRLSKNRLYSRLFETMREFIFLKNRQQETLFYSHYCLGKLLDEMASRLGFDIKLIRSMTVEEINIGIKENIVEKNKIRERSKHCIIAFKGGSFEIITGKNEIRLFLKENLEEEFIRKLKKIVGQPACMGHAEGRVKIIQSPEDMKKMNNGDILVSSKTFPGFLPAIRKASAIVTDYGGITCHAAIVSKELNIPCIIGTKNATKILKDGDLVRVDAVKGVVKKISD